VTVVYEIVPGARVEAVGAAWAAYSPVSGETMLLSPEGAVVMEILAEGSSDQSRLCSALARDCGLPEELIGDQLGAAWPRLVEAGLVRRALSVPNPHR
jgi:PqqD family protein of HPr-rel-A system